MREYLVEEELEHYRFGWISRREFIRRALLIGISAATATALAKAVTPAYTAPLNSTVQASPFSVPENDPSVVTQQIWFPSNDGVQILGYQAWPVAVRMDTSHPAVVVIHANSGLGLHVMDVARRFAKQGYVAIAPDLVSRGGTPAVDLPADQRVSTYAALNAAQSAQDARAALEILKAHPAVDATKLAATGYCAGGGITWRLSTIAPDLVAAAPFYGSNPPLDTVPNIKAAVMAVYGGLDERLNANIPDVEAALQAAGTTHAVKIYPESMHGFHDDSRAEVYNASTASEAWIDTLNWFAQHLGLPAPQV